MVDREDSRPNDNIKNWQAVTDASKQSAAVPGDSFSFEVAGHRDALRAGCWPRAACEQPVEYAPMTHKYTKLLPHVSA